MNKAAQLCEVFAQKTQTRVTRCDYIVASTMGPKCNRWKCDTCWIIIYIKWEELDLSIQFSELHFFVRV